MPTIEAGFPVHLIKPHVSGRSISAVLERARQLDPKLDVRELCRKAGLPYEFVADEHGYVSYRFQRDIDRLLMARGLPATIFYEAGLEGLKPDFLHPAIYQQFEQLGSAERTYLSIPQLLPLFNRLLSAEVTRLPATSRGSQCRVSFGIDTSTMSLGDLDDLRECFYFVSENCRGYLDAIPQAFGSTPACSTLTYFDPQAFRFEFLVEYSSPSRRLKLVPGTIAQGLIWISAVLAPVLAGWRVHHPLSGVLGSLLVAGLYWMHKREKFFLESDLARDKTIQSLENMGTQYSKLVGIALNVARASDSAHKLKQVVHDIRSPLLALQAIQNIPPESTPRELLHQTTQRIRDLADEILKAPDEVHQTERCDVYSILASVVGEKRLTLRPQTQLRFLSQGTDLEATSRVQPSLFARAISNLIDNAAEAIENAGQIEIDFAKTPQNVVIQIKDTGRGFPDEVLQDLGKPGLTVGKPEGHGLGLSFAKSAIENWGGALRVESQQAQGSKVQIILPRASA